MNAARRYSIAEIANEIDQLCRQPHTTADIEVLVKIAFIEGKFAGIEELSESMVARLKELRA